MYDDNCSKCSDEKENTSVQDKDKDKNYLDPVYQQRSRNLDARPGVWMDCLNDSENNTPVETQFPEGITTNISLNSLKILDGTLTIRRGATHVTKLNTRLIESIPGGDTAYMSRLLKVGASPNATCRLNHVSACHLAAFYNNDALALLLESGADCSRSDKQGRTPLHLAAWAGNAEQIASLLKFPEALRKAVVDNSASLSPETVEEVKRHSLPVNSLTNTACQLNVEATLCDSWSDGMEHNCRNFNKMLPLLQQGWTALHAASARAHHHCVQLLIAAGADTSAQDLLCRTPFDVAGCAHYMGYKIEVTDFKKTIKLLKTGGKFQRCLPKNNFLNMPLHTAVELESEEAVIEVLLCGASATVWNSQGLTAMHICVKKRNKELLQLLANHEYINKDPHLATVDVKDRMGATVLCAAIKEGWIQGVYIALGAGASITMKDNGESPIHTAAQLGNIDIVQEILNVVKLSTSTIDFRNENGETPLFKAIGHNHIDVVKLLLTAGSNIEAEISGKSNVFHIAAKHGNEDILQHLLEYNSNITARMINVFDDMGPPLLYAVSNNYPACAELLITKGAQVDVYVQCKNSISRDILRWTSLLHIAAIKNHCEIAKLIIKHDSNTVHSVDSTHQSPLHEACSQGNREIIVLLLREGADLSGFERNGKCKKAKLAPIDILMNNLSKPTGFVQEIFDSYISSRGMSIQEFKCEVEVDYGILVPNKYDIKQMRVVKALIDTGNRYDQNRLLLHPLVQSFLYLKWKALLPFFYSILVLHACFVLSLNVYVVSVFYYKDRSKPVPLILHSNVWVHVIYLTVCLIIIQEIIFIKIKNTRYLLYLETWLKFGAIILALFLPQLVSWESEPNEEWARLIATVTLLLSWFEMMFLLSRFPDWGYYVLMFGKVASKVFKILLSFVFLIFGFSVTFMIQFRGERPFEGPWSAFVKTMVMMTSEFDYKDTINKEIAREASASIIILRIIFLSFLILVSIVLMNLLVGVAVNNVNNLEIIGSIKRLEKQVEFITSLEDILCNKHLKKILPNSLYKKSENVIVLRPREATCNRLPARLREAIFEKAQLQKKQSDAELGSMLFQMKLDEMYKFIVKQDSDDSNKSEKPDNAKNIIEEINKMRSEIACMKNLLDKTKQYSSRKSVPLLVFNRS